MKHTVTLTMTSLLSVFFTTFDLTDDIVRGISPGGLSNVPVVLVLAVGVYATWCQSSGDRGSSSSS
ncbi:MAG: hypothetical protein M3S32_04485 [Acidobacteriota bacterium]|nr:hypothetical protein [Acidobacteriota bacterium]